MPKKPKLVLVSVPEKHRAKIKAYLRELTADERPAKPIKRKEPISASYLRNIYTLIETLGPLLKWVEKEEVRIEELLGRNLTQADRDWAEGYEERLVKVSIHAENVLR